MLRSSLVLCIVVAAGAPACKVVKTPDAAQLTAAGNGTAAQGDMNARVATMWDAEVMPHFQDAATDLAPLRTAIGSGLDAAGAAHGYRPKSEDSPWNFPVRFNGTIVAAKTDSRAATADVDIDGDGSGDATLQLGPVIKGTALRDVLPFIDFTAFRDQIEFAQLARALNTKAYELTLGELPREDLVGQEVAVLGAFTLRNAGEPIVVTPVSLRPAGEP